MNIYEVTNGRDDFVISKANQEKQNREELKSMCSNMGKEANAGCEQISTDANNVENTTMIMVLLHYASKK